ncbi:MAG: class I SAM-dependent methyltransferase [Acidobacteriota bacterium]|mgnify:CR=1 FL=1
MTISATQCTVNSAGLSGTERLLLLTPGPHGEQILPELLKQLSGHDCVVLESDRRRLLDVGNGSTKVHRVLGRAARLPFVKHSFDAILSFESLYAIRPPWTVLAEFHRVLVPDGKLILFEPAAHGVFSALRDRIAGPGKRIFTPEEVKFRLARGDWDIQQLEEIASVAGMRHPAYCVRAIKKENPAEPVPQFLTAKEMIERRKKKHPQGEELP